MRLDRLCLLSIDPARSSGWAIFAGTELHDSGRALTATDRADAVERWLLLAATKNLVRAVVAEDWFRGSRSHATTYAMGASYGRWVDRLEDTGIRADWVLRVKPSEWRKALGFKARGRVRLKRESVAYAERLGRTCGDDEADAICLGAATLQNPKWFANVLPARQQKLLAETTL